MPNPDLRNETEDVFAPASKFTLPTDPVSVGVALFVAGGCALARSTIFDGEGLTDLANVAVGVASLLTPLAHDHFYAATGYQVPEHVVAANLVFILSAALMPDMRGWGTKAKYGLVGGALYAIGNGWASADVVVPLRKS